MKPMFWAMNGRCPKQRLGSDGGPFRVMWCLRTQEHPLTMMCQGPGRRYRIVTILVKGRGIRDSAVGLLEDSSRKP